MGDVSGPERLCSQAAIARFRSIRTPPLLFGAAPTARSASSAWASECGSCMGCFRSSPMRAKARGSKCACPSPQPIISHKVDAALEKDYSSMNIRPRILLADDHVMLLDAFKRLLESRCEIVDISMPGLNDMDACAQLRRKMPGIRLVFLTVNEDPDIAAEAIGLGASTSCIGW
jgi:hypothetical protein